MSDSNPDSSVPLARTLGGSQSEQSEAPSGALFTRDGEYFIPTDRSRGPWSPDSLHGSPVAALIAFCVEEKLAELDIVEPARTAQETSRSGRSARSAQSAPGASVSSELRIARQTVDLFRPVPYGRLSVEVEPIRRGRRIAVFQTQISCEGTLLAQATTLCLLAGAQLGAVGADHGGDPPASPEAADQVTIDRVGNRWVSYPGTLEMRHVTPPGGAAPPVVWIRTDAPVLAEVPPSPTVRAAAIADFVSPFANMQPGRSGYVNADITLHVHRPPVGDWHYLRVVSRGAADGVATAQAVLGDRSGAYGGSSAASLINP